MLIVIPFCHKDAKGAVNLLEWMFELDGQQTRHRCLAVGAKGTTDELSFAVQAAAQKAFLTSKMVRTMVMDERGWPQSCNTLFTCAATYIHETLKCPFWWNEVDCIPLKPKWLDMMEDEYLRAKKPFMGSVVTEPCQHLTGCAIYPHDIAFYNHLMLGTENAIAWDCIYPQLTIPHTRHTNLFHHCWDDPVTKKVATFPTVASLSMIHPEAAVFHRNKDHTLIKRLRERNVSTPSIEIEQRETIIGPKVFTYFDDIGRSNELELIDEWKKTWRQHGWNPVVIGDREFESAPGKIKFIKHVSAFPTINDKAYELACYKRWLAMTSLGGGLMTDYDVMNYGFTPAMAAKENGKLVFYEDKIPSAVLGNARQFKMMAQAIASYKVHKEDEINGKPHVSDMFIVHRLWDAMKCKLEPLMRQFGDEGWKDSALVHYPNSKTKGDKLGAIRQHPEASNGHP